MQRFAIIGLGNFGTYLATRLHDKGYDVIALDQDPDRVHRIQNQVTQAVVGDATDLETLESLGLRYVDVVVVCIGTEMNNSILAVLNLKDMGVKRLLAMAISGPHGRILQKLGVQELLFPERDLAISLAERLHNPNLVEFIPFIKGYGIIQFELPPGFVGKRLFELDLINRFGIQVLAVRQPDANSVNLIPTAKQQLQKNDILYLLGSNESFEKLRQWSPEEPASG